MTQKVYMKRNLETAWAFASSLLVFLLALGIGVGGYVMLLFAGFVIYIRYQALTENPPRWPIFALYLLLVSSAIFTICTVWFLWPNPSIILEIANDPQKFNISVVGSKFGILSLPLVCPSITLFSGLGVVVAKRRRT